MEKQVTCRDPPPISFAVHGMINVSLRPSSANVSTAATNSNETTLEADSHANTTCLGGGVAKIIYL